jgi:hypothetical protein
MFRDCALDRSAARSVAILICGASVLMACHDATTTPTISGDRITFTTEQVNSLDSTGSVIETANPTNGTLKSLVDSTLLVFTAGIEAQRLDITTNLTAAPLYFVGIHRVINQSASSSFSTWTLVGMDDPSHLVNLVEASGFAQAGGTTAPSSVSGTIGDGTGLVNALFLQVAAGGSVTQWNASSGSVSFSSDAPGAACPNFTPTAKVTCSLETMHVQFTANASNASGARQASIPTSVAVPAMRLTIIP